MRRHRRRLQIAVSVGSHRTGRGLSKRVERTHAITPECLNRPHRRKRIVAVISAHFAHFRYRAPDAAQRVALAKRCAAEPGPYQAPAFGTIPVLRSSTEEVLHRARDTKRLHTLRPDNPRFRPIT